MKASAGFPHQADWFIHHDADDRESPWRHQKLRDAIRAVDRAGSNAIDFELLNFRPTNNAPRRNRRYPPQFKYYEFGDRWDKLQIRWKNLHVRVGVFPVRFVLRHYRIRSQAYGERKIVRERRPRFNLAEREGGWHVQYGGFQPRSIVASRAKDANTLRSGGGSNSSAATPSRFRGAGASGR